MNLSAEDDDQLTRYLSNVAEALAATGTDPSSCEQVIAELREHALYDWRARGGEMTDVLARMDPPTAFVAAIAKDGDRPDPAATLGLSHVTDQSRVVLGLLSAALAIAAPVVAHLTSDAELFDTPSSGLSFLAGEAIALIAGLMARATPYGRLGAIAAGGMLAAFFTIWVLLASLGPA